MNKNTTRRAWRVEHINTVPMTPQQYNLAVTALAALVKQWIHKLENMNHNGNPTQEKTPTRSKEIVMARSVARRHDKKNFMATLSDVVRVGIYVRRSTDDENQPYSIEAQTERLLAYIASQPGWQLVDRFSDDASGATTERKDLQRALTAAHMGLIDVLLVLRVDRFSRDLRDLVMLLDELDQAGVVFRSATEPFDTATPMGRMLVQMLGTFAQFEREVIIDRVIAGMETKAQQGKWKGGKRPYGYQVDNKNHILIIDEHEAVIVRLIFDLYTKDRLGARSIATILNQRGHRTTSEGRWSAQQILRILSNRVYLGELTFRNITKTDTHPAIIDTNTWTQAQTILDARGQNPAHRAANGHDYMLTGRLRCPQCGKAMIGTRATGRNKTYRYYTCYNLARYDTTKCNFPRLDADDIDTAIITALGGFYRNHHTLIHDVITDAQRQHHAAHTDRHTELANIQAELTKTNQAIDRYLTAFERGTLDETLVADRLIQLRDKTKQLRIRHDELTLTQDTPPTAPSTATLDQITEHITTIINTGSANQRKALIENLVDHVTITGPDRLIPVFRIPQPHTHNQTATAPPAQTTPKGSVRTPTTLVEILTAYSHSWQAADLRLCHTMALTSPVRAARPSAKRPWSLRERLDEHEIAELITAYRDGATVASLATTHGVSFSSVKRLLYTAGVRRTPSTRRPAKTTPTTTYP